MADDTATPRSVRDIIDENLKEEQNPANPNFETALLNFHKYKAQVDDLVQEASKLDEETKHLTFGREEDYEAFKKATAAASAYRDKHYKVSVGPSKYLGSNVCASRNMLTAPDAHRVVL